MSKIYHYVAKWVDNHLLALLLSSLATAMAIVVLWPFSVIVIPSGYMGVLWSRFGGGTVLDKVYHEGTRLILPWNKMFLYDIRLQRVNNVYNLLTKGSLHLQVEMDFIFRPYEPWLPYIHKFVGPNYVDVVLSPVVAAEARQAFAGFTVDSGPTEGRRQITENIEHAVNRYLLERFNPPEAPREPDSEIQQYKKFIAIEAVLINQVTLPAGLSDAVIAKSVAREKVETYQFILQAEHLEADRKAVEASGIRMFSENVGNGLTDEYLRLKTIDVMGDLAKSPNSKVVVLGGQGGNLPIVFGADGVSPVASTPLPPAPSPHNAGTPSAGKASTQK